MNQIRPFSPDSLLAGQFSGRNVLVTGGLGFLGSNLAVELVRLGARVTLFDSLIPQFGGSFRNIESIRDRVTVHRADMRDSAALDAAVAGMDFIFHLAGQVSHGDSMRDPQLDLEVNCVATMNLVESCRKHNTSARLVYTSTRQVYGRPITLPVTEAHPTLPIDVNGINKLAAEYYHLLYHSVYGIRSTVLRLTNTYGPRQKISTDRQGVAAVFLHRALSGQPIELYGGGLQKRDFNYVDDVLRALLLAVTTPACYGQVLNLGAPRAHSLLEFVQMLARFCPCDVRTTPFPSDSKMIDIGDYYGDFTRFQEATGWVPEVELEEGLRRTVEYYRSRSGGGCNEAAVA